MLRGLADLRLQAQPLWVALLVLLLGLAATAHYSMDARSQALAEQEARFMHEVERLQADMQEQLLPLEQSLNALRGLFQASNEVTAAEFRRFLLATGTQKRHPQGAGLGWVARVPRAQLAEFVARQQRQGQPQFAVQAGASGEYAYPVTFLEPAGGLGEALGFDIAAEPRRRAAAEAAMASGGPVLSARIDLQQAGSAGPGAWLLLPQYASAEVPQTLAERERSLRGWTFAPLVFSAIMAGVPQARFAWLDYQLFDSPQAGPLALLVDSRSVRSAGPTDAAPRLGQAQFSVMRPVVLVGQVFYLQVQSTPAFENGVQTQTHLHVAWLGSCLSLAAALLVGMLLSARASAQERSRSLTRDMERLAMVAERTNNAVYFCDMDWRITWINDGFTRMSGFSAQEALGLRPSQLLHSPQADPMTPHNIDTLAEAGKRVEIQVLQRNKNGIDYWAALEVMPILDAKGRITSYISVQSDVTEENQVKAALRLEKERAENILTGTNVGTWESNLLTGEHRWNDRWSAMMGFSRHEVQPNMDAFWQQRLHPADRDRMNRAMVDCVAGRTEGLSCDVRVMHRDGSWMWVLCRAKVLSVNAQGRTEWIGGLNTDISDIKQVELSLRDMEDFLDRAGRMAGLGAWQIDFKTRQVIFSPQTCAIHGLAEGFQPTEDVAMSFYPEPGRERLRQAMRRAEQDGASWDMVVEFCTAQGQQLWVRSVGEVGFDDSGPVRLVGALQDVTQAHLAQLEVARSSALLRGAIEAIDEAFVLFDPQDRLVFCNDKYRALHAKSADLMQPGASYESIIRGGAERGLYQDAVGRIDAWVQESMALHHSDKLSMEQRLDDGRWLKVIEQRMPDGHRVGFRVDITELKQATSAAEQLSARRGEEQRRLQSILEGTHVGTWEWNVQTGESIYNDQYVGMLGYTLQELEPLGYATWKRLAHPDDLLRAAALLDQHVAGALPDYEIEVRMRHKEGHWIWVLARGKLAQRTADGRPLWVYGTHMDITERKRAERELAQTSAMLQNVLDSATAVGVVTMDLDHVIRVFNKGAENLLGYAAGAVVEQQRLNVFFEPGEMAALGDTLALMTGQAPAPRELLAHVLQNREPQEWTLLRQDGSHFQASLIFSPMRDGQGALEGYLAVIYDISRQKEYESSLREAMHLAEQSSVAKSQFLANMSHEIRTPMNAILGMLQLLRSTALDRQQNDYTGKAMGAARSLLGLLNDILDFSKVEAGKMQLNAEPFELEALLADLSVILSSNLGGRKVDLVFELDPALPRELLGDVMRLKQILINLGGNAVKFTEQGEVVIRWSLLARTAEHVRLAVEVIDTGIGIAPENQARIFDAFTQAEANTTRRFGGTGLGLVISTRLIRLMGGELQLQSAPGQGSTFSFTLDLKPADFPLALEAPQTPQLEASAAVQGQAAPPRVLLVDDNPRAQASSAAMLRGLGWEVAVADSGAGALAWLQAEIAAARPAPQALYLDAELQDMDAWEAMRQVRRLYAPAAPPHLILISRQSRAALAQRSPREHGLVDGLLVRPVTAAMLAHALAHADGSSTALGGDAALADGQARSLRLQGMRILLVEDNPINQQVAQELLQAEGAQVVLADNGALGLATLEAAQPPFDVVLMDLQMPVMDGLSATRKLRSNPRFATLPVIAMTANAMLSDREECLAAGMNDHVGKPFELKQLLQTLLQHTRWVAPDAGAVSEGGVAQPGRHAGEHATGAAPGMDTAAGATAWPEGLAVEQALGRMGGNRQLLARAMRAFADDAAQLPQRLGQLLQDGALQQLQRELHSLKGLSATLGAGALSTLAAQAERQVVASVSSHATGHASTPSESLLQPMLAELAHSAALLEQAAWLLLPRDRRAKPAPGGASPSGQGTDGAGASAHESVDEAPAMAPGSAQAMPSELAALLAELLAALKSSDMQAMELHAQLQSRLGATMAEQTAALDQAMAELDFEDAAQACTVLQQQWFPTENLVHT